jgi:hypothetical protein
MQAFKSVVLGTLAISMAACAAAPSEEEADTTASEVITANCPERLRLRVGNVSLLSRGEMRSRASFDFASSEEEKDETFDGIGAEIDAAMPDLKRQSGRETILRRTTARNALCDYQATGQEGTEARIAGRKGSERIQVSFAPGASVFVKVTRFERGVMEAESGVRRISGFYDTRIDGRGPTEDVIRFPYGFANVTVEAIR